MNNDNIIIIIFALPFLILLYHVLVYFFTGVPIIITPKKYYNNLFSNIEIKKNAKVYELGCGWGDFLFAVEKYQVEKIIGYDLSLFHVLISRIKANFKKSKAKIFFKNYFKADISDADIIYLFSVTPILIKTWEKIKKETKKGTTVIVLSDKIPGEKFIKRIPTKKSPKTTFFHIYRV